MLVMVFKLYSLKQLGDYFKPFISFNPRGPRVKVNLWAQYFVGIVRSCRISMKKFSMAKIQRQEYLLRLHPNLQNSILEKLIAAVKETKRMWRNRNQIPKW